MEEDLTGDISGLRLSSRLAPNSLSWADMLLPGREGGREEVLVMSPSLKLGRRGDTPMPLLLLLVRFSLSVRSLERGTDSPLEGSPSTGESRGLK